MMLVPCPSCGEGNPPSAGHCGGCGAELSQPEEASLNFVADSVRRSVAKVPMEEAKNLLRLQFASEQLRQGKMTAQEFVDEVDEVLYVVEAGIELGNSPSMKSRRAKMNPKTRLVYQEMAKGADEMYAGLMKMRSFLTNHQLSQVEAGLAQVEAGLWKIDHAQDLANQNIEG